MSDGEIPMALWVLMGVLLLLMLLTWISQLRTSARMRRIEYFVSRDSAGPEEPSLNERKAENKQQKRLFQAFLDEEPYRRNLPKKEQFAAFRKWRSEKGLNWSKGD